MNNQIERLENLIRMSQLGVHMSILSADNSEWRSNIRKIRQEVREIGIFGSNVIRVLEETNSPSPLAPALMELSNLCQKIIRDVIPNYNPPCFWLDDANSDYVSEICRIQVVTPIS